MGYEEVETVLPVDFVTRPDPAAEQSNATAASEGQDTCMASEVPANHSDTREKKRSGRTIVGLWRDKRKKSRSRKSKKKSGTQSASDDENISSSTTNTKSKSKSKSRKRGGFHMIRLRTNRSVDSNATVVASNTTKSKHVNESIADADVKLEVPACDTSLPTVEEGRHSPTTSAGTYSSGDNSCGEDKAKTQTHEYTEATELSVEVGDESDQFAMQIPSVPSREMERKEKDESVHTTTSTTKSFFSIIKNSRSFGGTESKQAVATVAPAASPATPLELHPLSALSSNAGASVRTSGSNKSTKSNMSTKSNIKESMSKDDANSMALVIAKDNEQDATDVPKAANTNSEALAVVDHTRWVKNVSISIGRYNTSFTVSDPMANLADAVKDAIDVVSGDANLCQQAKELDGIHTKDDDEEDERDYDYNPTRLFAFIQQQAWPMVLTQLQHHPHEAKVWVFRKARPEKAPNVHDADENKEALTVQHSSLVVHDGKVRFRWRLLPLHAAIVLGAPSKIIQEIIRAYPDGAKKSDELGSLPVHLAASRLDVDPEGEKVVLQLFGAHPDSIDMQDRKGRTATELAKLARSRKEIKEQRKIKACNSSCSIVTEMPLSEQLKLADNASEDVQVEDDDNRSVKSSMSGRFQQMLRKSKSTDTALQKKRNKKKTKQQDDYDIAGLSRAKSMDRGCEIESVADDANIASSLGPGFAFLKTSKSQEAREWAASPEGDAEREPSEEEYLVIISKEYQLPHMAPQNADESALNIPLPMSFSMGDDISVPVSMKERTPSISSQKSSPKSPKSVTIHEELNVDHLQDMIEKQEENEGLLVLLEKAAENAGRRGMDVSEFLNVLKDEWVTDVEALRRLDGRTLDELLPIMLSRELQRLIHHADSIDNKFLEDRGRGRSPSKKEIKKRSTRRIKKSPSTRDHHHHEMPPQNGSLAPICEDGENPHLTPDGAVSETKDDKNDQDDCAADPTKEQEEDDDNSFEEDNLILTASKEDLEIRHRHAALIAEARKAFPTRASLEDCINLRREEVEAAVNSGFDVDKETLARAALADDEIRKLLPLRLILPTWADLVEMVQVLQTHKENAGRDLKLDEVLELKSEIEEIQGQIDLERKYLAAKRPKGILRNT